MIDEHHEEQASLYALGVLSPEEAEELERKLSSNPHLQKLVTGLRDVGAALPAAFKPVRKPSVTLKSKVMRKIADREIAAAYETWCRSGESLVVTDKEGRIEWVNDAFTRMCGYTLDELRGQKPGSMLQGERTDRSAVARLRESIHARRPVVEELVNYTKEGEPYWVSISITPVFDNEHEFCRFVAVERELVGREFA